jgi:hypothetical protein
VKELVFIRKSLFSKEDGFIAEVASLKKRLLQHPFPDDVYMVITRQAFGLVLATLLLSALANADSGAKEKRVLTHADAAIILAKYSGYFDRYVDKAADLQECVSFLNKTGVYFGLMEVVNRSEFTAEDCARAMGQIDLVLSGEAAYIHGKVKLPKGIETWSQFCTMNDVKYREGYELMVEILLVDDARMN